MQANTSFVILDPKGEIVRDVGNLLEKRGYEIRVLDLISMEKSHCYNPFVYLHSDTMYSALSPICLRAPPKGSQSQDPFWDTSASMLLSALIYYLHYEAPEDEQNFAMVMEMLQVLPSTMRKILDLHRWTACFPTWSWTDPTTSL